MSGLEVTLLLCMFYFTVYYSGSTKNGKSGIMAYTFKNFRKIKGIFIHPFIHQYEKNIYSFIDRLFFHFRLPGAGNCKRE
jgi:hypothetical protein